MSDLIRIPVLLYHRIDREAKSQYRPFCVDPDAFAQQMAWLAENGFATISLKQLQDYYQSEGAIPERPIVVTFDDGYLCNYTRAFPILHDKGFFATVFLATDLIRNGGRVVESKDAFLAWDEIKEMHEAGFSFESHGCSHRPLDTLSLLEVEDELRKSKDAIAARLDKEVDYFCYPFSRYNETIKRLVQENAYLGACGGPPFWQGGPKDWFEIGRTEILWSDSFKQFRFKVQHGLGYYYFAKRQLGKIKKLAGHDHAQ
ncbi:MAG: polysaccharide deacetylase family protein [bacterium]